MCVRGIQQKLMGVGQYSIKSIVYILEYVCSDVDLALALSEHLSDAGRLRDDDLVDLAILTKHIKFKSPVWLYKVHPQRNHPTRDMRTNGAASGVGRKWTRCGHVRRATREPQG